MFSFKDYLEEAKLQPDSSSKVMGTNELVQLLGKTRVKAMMTHPFFKRHLGDHSSIGFPLAHKVTVNKFGYPTVMSSSAFSFNSHDGKKTRTMIQTSLSPTASSRVHQMHVFYNRDNERHEPQHGGSPVWIWSHSLHNDEEKE